MSADAQMRLLGEHDGVRWYWAAPGMFHLPGVYYWDGGDNVRVEKAQPAPSPQPTRRLTVTTTESGEALMVSWQDDDHQILEVVWERKESALQLAAPVDEQAECEAWDGQIRKTVEAVQDPDTVPAFHNGYYTLTPGELRRVILALRPADEAAT